MIGAFKFEAKVNVEYCALQKNNRVIYSVNILIGYRKICSNDCCERVMIL